jgi:flagellar hook-basal body complex protein FliE
MEIEGTRESALSRPEPRVPGSGGASFADAVTQMLQDVNSDQVQAAGKIRDLAVDGEGSIHEAMVAMSNAEGSFRLMMEIRNRIVQTVNELLQTGR